MKISLALGPRRPLDRQTAWGCLTSNLALPGLGSLVAGRTVGYPQLILGLTGFSLTMLFGGRLLWWYLRNWTRLRQLQEQDPLAYFQQIWPMMRPALLGIAVFVAGLLWALTTSLGILRAAQGPPAPPILPPT